jgi:UDP-N-acetylglucosamine 2-epimerase (non-hydrolysing)
MKKVVFVAGARPNFMKVAPVLAALGHRPVPFHPCLVHTGQHYDEQMSGVFFEQLGLPPPEAYLNVGGGTHGMQTGRIMEAFERYLLELADRPAGVVVVGDVNSTVACSLAAVKLQIPVTHLEAGLRSFDRTMPEEINRIVTDVIADLLLVSEPAGETNLLREGIPAGRIRYIGNVMIDTLLRELPAARALCVPRKFGLEAGDYAVVTLHRPSNVDDPERLCSLMALLWNLARRFPVVFPAHPRTRQRLEQSGLAEAQPVGAELRILEPLPYREMLGLQAEARVVITDSGGIQEETTFLGVPCLTMRPNTERPITVSDGTNTLIPGDPGEAERWVQEILAGRYKAGRPIPGWDGRAGERASDVLVEAWGG